jgi:primosomal protein N' (replication factor Y)
MTDARTRVIGAIEDMGGAPLTPSELARMAGVTASVVKGLEHAGTLIASDLPRDTPFPSLDSNLPAKTLNSDQARAVLQLREAVRSEQYGTTLLKGVTGSGKTEVYLEAVAEAIRTGRQALVMIPEIALTGAFLDRIEARFGARPAEWHHGVTLANRRRTWKMVATGGAQVVVGARSALFLPFRDLGLIVVDEEHDTSYKQEDGVLYNARDMAVLRASLGQAQVVLASATPSLESWANADAGKYARLELTERFGTAVMPEIGLIDMRGDPLPRNRWIGADLAAEIEARLGAAEQSLLFLNRRGYAPLTVCRACGHQVECHQCDARMVEHRFIQRLVCHQCGESRAIPTTCPSCGEEGRLGVVGPGVERLAEEVVERFPEARVEVLSSDMTESTRALRTRIAEIAEGGADIIIGTQIVAKGHNFPKLTLVGVIDADLGLGGADLRAAERTYQLIRQVAGRAGRADKPGIALLQTHQPDHPVMQAIQAGNDEAFWRAEAASRRDLNAPPYGRWAGVIVSGPEEGATWDVARALARNAGLLTPKGITLLGPAPAPIARVRGRVRVRMLARAAKGVALQEALAAWRQTINPPAAIRIAIDIDPQSFF